MEGERKREQPEELGGDRGAEAPSDFSWCDEAFRPVLEMKLKLLGFYYDDLEFHELLRWLPQHSIIKKLEKQVSLSNKEESTSPLVHIQKKCRDSAEGLAQGQVILCVYGGVNVGKSSLCNMLLGNPLLHVTNVQCTAVPAIVHSAPFKNEARVFFADNVDIQATLADIESKKPALQGSARWEQCKRLLTALDLQRRSRGTEYATLEDLNETLPVVSSLSLDLRKEKILNRVEVHAPILGLEENGLCLVDCPGLQENEFLTHVAQSHAQHSAIVIYVMNCFTGVTDDDLHFLASQAMNGCDVMFVFNRKATDSEESVTERLLDIRSRINSVEVFKKSTVYEIDTAMGVAGGMAGRIDSVKAKDVFLLPEEERRPMLGLRDFLFDLNGTISKRSRGMIFNFARSFYQLMHTQYLVISRIISAKMKTDQARSLLSFKKKTEAQKQEVESLKKMKKLRVDIRSLIKEADAHIALYKSQFADVFLRVLTRLEPTLLMVARDVKVDVAYEQTDDSWIKNVINVLYNKAPTQFEEHVYKELIATFVRSYGKEYADWITHVRLEFSKTILQKANGIEHEANVLRNELTRQNVSVAMDEMFRQTERQIGDLFAAQLAIAGPLVGVLAGGATFTVPWLLVGAVSTAFLAGGMMLLAGVALAGIVTSILSVGYVQKISNRTEQQTRQAVYESMLKNVAEVPNTKGFRAMVDEAVKPCVIMRDYVQSTLSMSLLQIESLSNVTDVDLSYEDLCNFIYIREELSEKLQLLSDSLHDFDRKQTLDMGTLIAQMEKALQLKHRQIQGMMLSRKTSMDNLLGCHYPQCFICRREFVHCSHLCAHCRVQLDEMDNSPCPACNRGSHLSARKVAGAGFSFVLDNAEKLDLGELEEDGVPHDFLPLYTNEKARVMRKLQAQQRCLDDFTTWFCDTHSAFQSHLITARNSINLFITSFVMHLSPANGQMPDVYRRMVIECLHELIYPAIHDSLLGLYRKQEKDDEISAVCALLADRDPIYFQAEVVWSVEDIARFAEPIQTLRGLGSEHTPLAKLHALFHAVTEFQDAVKGHGGIGADLLVPTLVYFLVQANVPHLRSIMTLIHDALDQTGLMRPDQEYVFVTVQSLVVEFPKICAHYESPTDTPLRINDD